MSLTIDEGYYDAKVSVSNDVDHGPCRIYTLDNGDSIVIYDRDTTLISFHKEDDDADC